ncbi:MAG TPA: hypothetical protein VFD14_03935, partial [Clostridia bacterium]|nr:hypothetical protein [Clostridia bacterium]
MNNPNPQAPEPGRNNKKKAALLAAILINFLAGSAIVLLLPKKKKTPPEPSQTPAGSQAEETGPAPLPYVPQTGGVSFVEALLDMDPYLAQHLGSNPVYYYPHPELNMAIDLRGHEEAARMLYVLPFSTGFSITSRRTILYQSGSLPSFQLGFEWYGSSVAIEWIPDEEMAAKLAVIDLYTGVEPGDYEFIPYLDGHLFLLDARSSFDPDPANLAAKLYGGPVIDRAFLQEFIRTLEEDPVLEETAGDARKEWQELLDLIEENPAKFEWTWLMPPYSADPAADRRPNEDFLRRVEGESVYTHYSIDLDGDGRMEHILHNHTPTLGRDSPEGYWAVYTETEAGLRLIGHSSTGSSSLIYGQDHFYYLSPPLPREDGWVLDAQLH